MAECLENIEKNEVSQKEIIEEDEVTKKEKELYKRIEGIENLFVLTEGLKDPELSMVYFSNAKKLELCQDMIEKLKENIKERREKLARAKILKEKILAKKAEMEKPLLPPSMIMNTIDKVRSRIKREGESKRYTTHMESPVNEMDDLENSETPTLAQVKKNIPSLFVNEIVLITQKEFDSLPGYMKGNLTLDKINQVVESLNKAVMAKYDIINSKKLNSKISKAIAEYKLQEMEETRGYNFIVEKDITDFTQMKIDKAMNNYTAILRHLKRIFQVRSGNIYRVVFK